ncbi:hypothetical protein OJ253_1051 [Cryptosporidium canis]|uniref:Histidine kinase/HSP90-like ATPase domain-containing protein n=1 Tax=Cryptosporidium canis TaxID=195482 RepID=A0A9D5HVF5_9CRYT|nr:hypothetical protein OJ253_1051 [Cryptosporidium canis]
MSNVSAINFFSENIGITGFDSENAPFMAFKELFDNSIDACNSSSRAEWHHLPSRVQASVSFENLELEDQARISIIVRDTGCGIPLESIDLLGTLFGTNKKANRRDSYYTGQFGVGLKMILLYATRYGEGRVKVKMRIESKIWEFTLLCNLLDGSFYVGNSECFDFNGWDWVTEFSVSMRLNLGLEYLQERYFSMELYAKSCLRRIQSYLLLSKLWNDGVSFSFDTNLRTEPPELGSGEVSLSFSDVFGGNSIHYSSSKGSRYKIDSVFGLLRRPQLKKEDPVDKENLDNPNSSLSASPESSLRPGHMYIYRFSNGMPIVCRDAEYCDIATSVKSFLRKRGAVYGMKLLKRDELCETHPEELAPFLESELLLPIAVVPTSEFSTRVLFINVKGHGIQYGTLGKSSLKSNAGLGTSIHQALRNLFKKCKDRFPSELMDIKEYTYKSSVERYSPVISKNLASMVMRSDSIVFKSGLLEILSRCDPEASASLSVLIEGNNEEKLREQLNATLCKWFMSRVEQGPSPKPPGEANGADSDDYIFEKEEGI